MPIGYGQCKGFKYSNIQPVYTGGKKYKACAKCGRIKHRDYFPKDDGAEDGRSCICHACTAAAK